MLQTLDVIKFLEDTRLQAMPRKAKNSNNKLENMEELLEAFDNVLFRGSDAQWYYDRIPFNIPVLDRLIGGGVPKKRITLLSGQTNSGKSYLATQVVKSVQKNGGTAAWIDLEMSWDADWMEKCGVNIDEIAIAQPTTGENAFGVVKSLMQRGCDLIVFDSIAGVIPSVIAEGDDFGYNPMAWQARFVNQSLPKLMSNLKHGSAVILINQIRSGIGNVSFLDTLPGGKAQTFFSHVVLQVRRSGWKVENDVKIGFDIEITNRKTKAGGYNQSRCVIPFRFNGGVDILEIYVREAVDNGLIEKSGAWYNIVSENKKVMGMNGLREHFQNNEMSLQNLIADISRLVEENRYNVDIDESEEEMLEE